MELRMEDRFSATDFLILYSVVGGRKGSSLRDIISKGDYLNRAVMTKMELDTGLNKLIYNGYLEKDSHSKYRWTKKTIDFYNKNKLRPGPEGCIIEGARMSAKFMELPMRTPATHTDYFTDAEYKEAVRIYTGSFHVRKRKKSNGV